MDCTHTVRRHHLNFEKLVATNMPNIIKILLMLFLFYYVDILCCDEVSILLYNLLLASYKLHIFIYKVQRQHWETKLAP